MNAKWLLTGLVVIVLATLNVGSIRCEEQSSNEIKDEYDGLRISVQTDKESYLIGEGIVITATLTNVSLRDLDVTYDVSWIGSGTEDVVKFRRWEKEAPRQLLIGLISKTYTEGGVSKNGMASFGKSEKVHIPIGKSFQRYYKHIAKEPGTVIIPADFYSVLLSPPDKEDKEKYGNWFGNIRANKKVEVKNEIHPDVIKVLAESENIILSSSKDSKEYDKAIENVLRIGFPAKDILLRLPQRPIVKENEYGYDRIIYCLANISNEAFDERLYRELINFACDSSQEVRNRLQVMHSGRMWSWSSKYIGIDVFIPPEFHKWMLQKLISLKDDENKEIKKVAVELLQSRTNQEFLEKFGMNDLLK